jgi:hypothetical protein
MPALDRSIYRRQVSRIAAKVNVRRRWLASAQPCECLLSSVRSEAVAARAAAVARGCAGGRVSSSGLRAEDEATALGGASAFGGPEPIPRWVVWVLGVLSSPMNKHNASLHSAASGADSTAGDRSFPAYDRQGHRRGTRPGDLLCVCPPGWHRFWSSWTGFRYATHFSALALRTPLGFSVGT